jgi:predicted nucleotidyltransferase
MTPQLPPTTGGLPQAVQSCLFGLAAAWPEIEKIILFGSRARDDAAGRSDIDLAIIAPTATRRQWLDLAAQLTEEAPTLLPFDLVRWEEAPPALRERIMVEGKTVYERDKNQPKPE